MKIKDQKISYNLNSIVLLTEYEDGSVKSEPLTPTEAAEWSTEKGYR